MKIELFKAIVEECELIAYNAIDYYGNISTLIKYINLSEDDFVDFISFLLDYEFCFTSLYCIVNNILVYQPLYHNKAKNKYEIYTLLE